MREGHAAIFLKLTRLEFLFKLTLDTTLQSKEERDDGRKFYKNRIAVLVYGNLDGTEKKKTFVSGKLKHPRRLQNVKILPTRYIANEAQITSDLFEAKLRH